MSTLILNPEYWSHTESLIEKANDGTATGEDLYHIFTVLNHTTQEDKNPLIALQNDDGTVLSLQEATLHYLKKAADNGSRHAITELKYAYLEGSEDLIDGLNIERNFHQAAIYFLAGDPPIEPDERKAATELYNHLANATAEDPNAAATANKLLDALRLDEPG